MRKALHLKREVLTELTQEELTGVAGGSHDCHTLPVDRCLSFDWCEASHHWRCAVPTLDQSCPC